MPNMRKLSPPTVSKGMPGTVAGSPEITQLSDTARQHGKCELQEGCAPESRSALINTSPSIASVGKLSRQTRHLCRSDGLHKHT